MYSPTTPTVTITAPEISTNSQNASHDDPVKAMMKLQQVQEWNAIIVGTG
jgi:hypothetical protein